MRTLAIFIGFSLLSGCASEPKHFLSSEHEDDKTCRSYMKNKRAGDDTTYEECRQSMTDLANNPGPGAPAPSNVTIIVNQ